MTKGLHKGSLRKVDNPHQWMIDDARMELIQQIKAEIERLKEKYTNMMPSIQKCSVCDELLAKLDTIQEQPVKGPFTGEQIYNFLKEQSVDLEKEIASFITQFGWGNTKHLAEKELINRTARHFYELGRNAK